MILDLFFSPYTFHVHKYIIRFRCPFRLLLYLSIVSRLDLEFLVRIVLIFINFHIWILLAVKNLFMLSPY